MRPVMAARVRREPVPREHLRIRHGQRAGKDRPGVAARWCCRIDLACCFVTNSIVFTTKSLEHLRGVEIAVHWTSGACEAL